MPTIPQEISQSTQTLTDNATIVEQFAQGAANTFIPVRGGTLRPLLYWQGTFQNKVTELAQPYVDQLVQANQVADGKVQAASDSAADANQSALEAAASAASVDFPTRLAELNAQQTRLARSLAAIGDHGQSLHSDFARNSYALGGLEGLDRTLEGEELWTVERPTPKWVMGPNGKYREAPPDTIARKWSASGEALGASIEGRATNDVPYAMTHSALANMTVAGSIEMLGLGDGNLYQANAGGAVEVNRVMRSLSGSVAATAPRLFSVYVHVPSGSTVQYFFLRARASDGAGAGWVFKYDGASIVPYASITPFGANPPASIPYGAVKCSKLPSGFWEIGFIAVTSTDPVRVHSSMDLGGSESTSELHASSPNLIFGAGVWQCKDETKLSSPIITTGAPLARAEDEVRTLLEGDWDSTSFTLMVDFYPGNTSDTSDRYLTLYSSGADRVTVGYSTTERNKLYIYYGVNSNYERPDVTLPAGQVVESTQRIRLAISKDGATVRAGANGGPVSEVTNVSDWTTVVNLLRVGREDHSGVGEGDFIDLRVIPHPWQAQQIQEITA